MDSLTFARMNNLLQQVENSKEEIQNFSTTDNNPAEVFRIQYLGYKRINKIVDE